MNPLATSVAHSTPGSSGRFLNKKSVKMRIQIILYLSLPGSIVLPTASKCSAIELGKKFERGGGATWPSKTYRGSVGKPPENFYS